MFFTPNHLLFCRFFQHHFLFIPLFRHFSLLQQLLCLLISLFFSSVLQSCQRCRYNGLYVCIDMFVLYSSLSIQTTLQLWVIAFVKCSSCVDWRCLTRLFSSVSVCVHIRPSGALLSLLSLSGCAKAGGVRFSEEPPAAGAPSHVHFDEKLHDSVVMVTPEDDGNFMVKVCLTL